jgi:hypothetical protein
LPVKLSSFVADIDGHQRKIVMSEVRPAKTVHGDSGIALRDGKTLPFVVTRAWNAPAGHYSEAWYLVHPESREVLHEGRSRQVLVWGLLSWTELTDDISEPFELRPGTYQIVFALGGLLGGQAEVQATEAPAEEAA